MPLPRTIGLLVTAFIIAVAAVSAQVPGKLPPGAKTTDPKAKPADPKATDKGKNPMTPGAPMLPAKPPTKKDDIKWPTEVNGRKLSETLKDMRNHADPAVREASVRALPFFGPEARKQGVNEFLEAMTAKENDWNVRIAAVDVAPTILVAFAEEPDTQIAKGLNAIANMLSSDVVPMKFAAVAAVGNVGPYMRKAEPRVIITLSGLARMQSFWQMRVAAVGALGRVGQAIADPDNKEPPDSAAVTTLLDILKSDLSAAVRREAVNSLIGVGPVAAKDQRNWRTTLDNILTRAATGGEKDKAVLLWLHVLIIRNDPNGLKGNEAHLDAIAKLLTSKEPAARLEGCQALGFLGEEASSKLNDLIDLLNKETVPDVAAAAIAAMAAMPKESAITIPVLQRVQMTNANKDVQKLAEEAIKFLNNPKKN